MASQGKEGYGVSEQMIDYEFKVVLIGDFEVGKCQILERCERKESKTDTAVTVKYETQTLHIEKKSVKAHIWGIIRQERNNVDSNADYKDANGVILVYDITNRKSFDCMTLCLEELHHHAKKRQAIILIGNKSDSENDREVLRKEARGFAEKNDLIFREISALEGTNFDNALKDLLTKLVYSNCNNTTNNTSNNNNTTTTTSGNNTTTTTSGDNSPTTTTTTTSNTITTNINIININ
ncbi:ras-related protein RABA4b-like isoform X2 [Quercus robur]|uniref:ras-related protein RABA4b-like isoform X2 n=1 Tax=Quercus robur TaxID=38942 RepID=UPI0021635A6B|nr:ras-related protein RABA4b-like isoform X2 [Quercus robur]